MLGDSMKSIHLCVAVALAPTCLSAQQGSKPFRPASAPIRSVEPQYAITLTDTVAMRARVTATLPYVGRRLSMDYWIPQRNLWRDRVLDLVVRDSAGRQLPVAPADSDAWEVAGAYAGRVTLDYVVDLGYTRDPMPIWKAKNLGFRFPGGALLSARPFIIAADTDETPSPRRIAITLPDGWDLAAPWTPEPRPASSPGVHTFTATSLLDLVRNSFVTGHFTRSIARRQSFTLTLALLDRMARDASQVVTNARSLLTQYQTLFPRTGTGTYLMALFYAEDGDGEAWERSAALAFGDRIGPENVMLFPNTIAHELLHYWNPRRFAPADGEREGWLSEGFTEYYANRAILRAGLWTRQQYLDKLARHLGNYAYWWYSPVFAGVTIREAGLDKTKNRFGVYDGGATVALCLDLLIRQRTGGTRSLDDVMRALFDFGATGKRYTYDDVVRVLVSVGGEEMRPFMTRYVSGRELLPFQLLLGDAAVAVRTSALGGEAYISSVASPTVSQTVLQAAWLGVPLGEHR